MPVTQITQKLEVKIRCIPRNPFYVKWIDTSGAARFFCFGHNQVEDMLVTAGAQFAPNITDLETMVGDSKFTSKTGIPEFIVGADGLDADDMKLIKTLQYTTEVYLLMNPTTWVSEGERWQSVRVLPAKFSNGETKGSLQKCELTVQLPQINIQSQ